MLSAQLLVRPIDNSKKMESDDSQFLSHGRIDLMGVDWHTRTAIYFINIPYVLLVHTMPAFLGCANITEVKVSNPLSVWQPQIESLDIKDEYVRANPNISAQIWGAIENHMNKSMAYYLDICHILKNPNIITNILPLGIYVSLKAMCRLDAMLSTIEELQKSIHIAGVAEFQFALSAALATALKTPQPSILPQ